MSTLNANLNNDILQLVEFSTKRESNANEEEDNLMKSNVQTPDTAEPIDDFDEIINKVGMNSYLIKLLIFGFLTCFADGSEMVVVSLIIRKLETSWKLTQFKKAFIGGSIFYGFLFGNFFCGEMMDKKGRKYTLVVGSLLFLVFGIASAFSVEFYSFVIFRMGVGLGLGFVIPATQTLLTEYSPERVRGFNSIIIWIGFPIGELYICYITSLFPLDDLDSHQINWLLIMILAAVPIFLNILFLMFLKESPRFHLHKNQFEEAFAIIEDIHRKSLENLSIPMEEKTKARLKVFYLIKRNISYGSSFASTLSSTFSNLTFNIWTMWFVTSYIFFGVLYLIPELVGKDVLNVNFNDLICAVVYSTVFEIFGILFTLIIEFNSIGRLGAIRISFGLSSLLTLLCLCKVKNWETFLHILKGSAQIATRALYVYTSECYPTEIRGTALGISNVFTRIGGIITPISNEILLAHSHMMAFTGMFIASMVGMYISWKNKKETLGKKIE